MPKLQTPARPPRKTQERSVETRTRLVECAIECLGELGYAGATTPVIAARAKVTRGALQYHFASRAELDVAVIDHVAQELNFRIDAEALATRPLEERVRAVIGKYWHIFTSPTFRAALHIWLSVTSDQALAKRLQEHLDGVKDAIDKTWQSLFRDCGRTAEELSTIRHVAMGSARGFGVELIFHPGEPGIKEQELLVAVTLAALRSFPARTAANATPLARAAAKRPAGAARR